MKIEKYKLEQHNSDLQKEHARKFDFIAADIKQVDDILQKLIDFQVAIPSWALGTGGTRFGRFGGGGGPRPVHQRRQAHRDHVGADRRATRVCDEAGETRGGGEDRTHPFRMDADCPVSAETPAAGRGTAA